MKAIKGKQGKLSEEESVPKMEEKSKVSLLDLCDGWLHPAARLEHVVVLENGLVFELARALCWRGTRCCLLVGVSEDGVGEGGDGACQMDQMMRTAVWGGGRGR